MDGIKAFKVVDNEQRICAKGAGYDVIAQGHTQRRQGLGFNMERLEIINRFACLCISSVMKPHYRDCAWYIKRLKRHVSKP